MESAAPRSFPAADAQEKARVEAFFKINDTEVLNINHEPVAITSDGTFVFDPEPSPHLGPMPFVSNPDAWQPKNNFELIVTVRGLAVEPPQFTWDVPLDSDQLEMMKAFMCPRMGFVSLSHRTFPHENFFKLINENTYDGAFSPYHFFNRKKPSLQWSDNFDLSPYPRQDERGVEGPRKNEIEIERGNALYLFTMYGNNFRENNAIEFGRGLRSNLRNPFFHTDVYPWGHAQLDDSPLPRRPRFQKRVSDGRGQILTRVLAETVHDLVIGTFVDPIKYSIAFGKAFESNAGGDNPPYTSPYVESFYKTVRFEPDQLERLRQFERNPDSAGSGLFRSGGYKHIGRHSWQIARRVDTNASGIEFMQHQDYHSRGLEMSNWTAVESETGELIWISRATATLPANRDWRGPKPVVISAFLNLDWPLTEEQKVQATAKANELTREKMMYAGAGPLKPSQAGILDWWLKNPEENPHIYSGIDDANQLLADIAFAGQGQITIEAPDLAVIRARSLAFGPVDGYKYWPLPIHQPILTKARLPMGPTMVSEYVRRCRNERNVEWNPIHAFAKKDNAQASPSLFGGIFNSVEFGANITQYLRRTAEELTDDDEIYISINPRRFTRAYNGFIDIEEYEFMENPDTRIAIMYEFTPEDGSDLIHFFDPLPHIVSGLHRDSRKKVMYTRFTHYTGLGQGDIIARMMNDPELNDSNSSWFDVFGNFYRSLQHYMDADKLLSWSWTDSANTSPLYTTGNHWMHPELFSGKKGTLGVYILRYDRTTTHAEGIPAAFRMQAGFCRVRFSGDSELSPLNVNIATPDGTTDPLGPVHVVSDSDEVVISIANLEDDETVTCHVAYTRPSFLGAPPVNPNTLFGDKANKNRIILNDIIPPSFNYRFKTHAVSNDVFLSEAMQENALDPFKTIPTNTSYPQHATHEFYFDAFQETTAHVPFDRDMTNASLDYMAYLGFESDTPDDAKILRLSSEVWNGMREHLGIRPHRDPQAPMSRQMTQIRAEWQDMRALRPKMERGYLATWPVDSSFFVYTKMARGNPETLESEYLRPREYEPSENQNVFRLPAIRLKHDDCPVLTFVTSRGRFFRVICPSFIGEVNTSIPTPEPTVLGKAYDPITDGYTTVQLTAFMTSPFKEGDQLVFEANNTTAEDTYILFGARGRFFVAEHNMVIHDIGENQFMELPPTPTGQFVFTIDENFVSFMANTPTSFTIYVVRGDNVGEPAVSSTYTWTNMTFAPYKHETHIPAHLQND